MGKIIKLEDQDIFDLDKKEWYTIKRGGWFDRGRLVLIKQVYLSVRRFPTGNHLYYSDAKGLHYIERGPPPPTPQPQKLEAE